MAFRPNGVPVTAVPGMPVMGYNQTIVAQPVTMVPMMQPTMIGVPVRNMPQMMPVHRQLGPQIVGQALQQITEVSEPVKVFVGNISEKAGDTLVRQILMKCGSVANWRRTSDPVSLKLQAFGFCEYKDPDSALRALRILQDFTLVDKPLLIKVDNDAQNIIEMWKKRVGVKQDSDGMDVLSPQVKARDEAVRNDLKLLLREYVTVDEENPKSETNGKSDVKSDSKSDSKSEKKSESKDKTKEKEESKSKSDISKEEYGEKKDIIVDQIEKFRETQKKHEEEKSKKSEDRKRESSKSEKSRDRDRERDRKRDSPERKRERRDRSKERSKSRRRDRSRERDRTRERTRERSRERRRRSEERRKDEEELIERRRLERKMKEKDSAYQERLIGWEARERRKAREWEGFESRDSEVRRSMYKEAKRLRDFLENYDDERDDRKFYFGSGSAFQRRLKNREREKELDLKDRRKEEEEIGGLRKKLASEGHPDPDGAIAKVIKEAEEVWKPFITPEVRKRKRSERSTTSTDSSSESESERESDDEPIDVHLRKKSSEQSGAHSPAHHRHHSSDDDDHDGHQMDIDVPPEPERAPLVLPGLSSNSLGRTSSPATNSPAFQSTFVSKGGDSGRSRKVAAVFQEEEEETHSAKDTARKRKVEKPKEIKNQEEKRKAVKALIDRIPTDRGPLFAYPMHWSNLTSDLMTNRITPWVQKKLQEIIGEDEPTLVAFITEKLESEARPDNILSEIRVVLDDEAEKFVIKLWRLLIYETEARREGITV